MPRVLKRSKGDWRFLMGEVTMQGCWGVPKPNGPGFSGDQSHVGIAGVTLYSHVQK